MEFLREENAEFQKKYPWWSEKSLENGRVLYMPVRTDDGWRTNWAYLFVHDCHPVIDVFKFCMSTVGGRWDSPLVDGEWFRVTMHAYDAGVKYLDITRKKHRAIQRLTWLEMVKDTWLDDKRMDDVLGLDFREYIFDMILKEAVDEYKAIK